MDFDLLCYPFQLFCFVSEPSIREASFLSWLKDNAIAVGFVFTGGTLIFTALTFLKAQAWKRKEFVANEFERLRQDEKAYAAMLMLDQNQVHLRIPFPHGLISAQYDGGRSTFPRMAKGPFPAKDAGYHVRVGTTKQVIALMHHREIKGAHGKLIEKPRFDALHMYLKECFDALFGRLGAFQAMVRAGLVNKRDVKPHLGYWLDLLTGCRKVGKDTLRPRSERRVLFAALKVYLEEYGYTDLVELVGGDKLKPSADDRALLAEVAEKLAAEQFGLTVEQLRELRSAADALGVTAEALGRHVSVDQLDTALSDPNILKFAASQQNISVDDLRARMHEARQSKTTLGELRYLEEDAAQQGITVEELKKKRDEAAQVKSMTGSWRRFLRLPAWCGAR